MTLTFEFGFGRLVEGLSWSTMLADYDVTSDRIWVLVPLWTAAVVAVVHSLQGDNRPREGRSRERDLEPGLTSFLRPGRTRRDTTASAA